MKKRRFSISGKKLGIALIVALIIDYVLPKAGIHKFGSIAVLIYLIVAMYLLIFV